MTTLSFLIVTYNSGVTIAACLDSIYQHAVQKKFEVLIWDNASTDNTKEVICRSYPQVKLFASQENLGFGAGNNFLLEKVKGEFVLLINPDARLRENCCDQLLEFLQAHPRVGAVGPALLYPDGRFQISWGKFPSLWNEFQTKRDWSKAHSSDQDKLSQVKDQYLKEGYVDWLGGACFLAGTEALQRIGGFDPNFFLYFEDVDLCRRLALAGYYFYFLPQAKVEHSLAQSSQKLPWIREIRSRQSQLYYYWKWKSPLELRLLKLYLGLKFWRRKLQLVLIGQLNQDAKDFFEELGKLLGQESYPVGKNFQKPPRRKSSVLNWLIDTIGRAIFVLIEPIRSLPKLAANSPRKILFIKLCCLGDVLFTTPTIRAVRKKFPGATLLYLTGSWCQEVMGWNPHIDKVIVFDAPYAKQTIYNKWKKIWSLIRRLRQEKIDLVVNFHRDFKASLLAWLSSAKHRIGFRQSGASFLFTQLADFDQSLPEVKRYLRLAEICGAKPDGYELEIDKTIPGQSLPEFSRAEAHSLTICLAPGGGKNPGTYMPIKRWPYYSELVRRLKSQLECRILLVGDKFDRETGDKIEKENPGAVCNLIGKTNLSQLLNILQSNSLFIGNDSGTLYLASALGIPTIGIYGPSDPSLVAPLGDMHISLKKSLYCSPCYRPDTVYGQPYFDCWTRTFDCMKKLSVEEVMQAVRIQLNKISVTKA